jgi:hypothetical protein
VPWSLRKGLIAQGRRSTAKICAKIDADSLWKRFLICWKVAITGFWEGGTVRVANVDDVVARKPNENHRIYHNFGVQFGGDQNFRQDGSPAVGLQTRQWVVLDLKVTTILGFGYHFQDLPVTTRTSWNEVDQVWSGITRIFYKLLEYCWEDYRYIKSTSYSM